MKILALDTSTLMATVAVVEDNNLLGEYSINQDMTHSENLMPMVEEVLGNLGMKIEEIDLYAVALGPGSFTGLRIGLATVKSFAHVFDKPIIGVSSLEGLAFNMAYTDIVIPMIDARRDRVYTAIYSWEEGSLKELVAPEIFEIKEILELAKKYNRPAIVGNGNEEYAREIEEALGESVRIARSGQNVCRASSIAELAVIKYEQGQRDSYFRLAPTYLRQTQAERELNEKNNG